VTQQHSAWCTVLHTQRLCVHVHCCKAVERTTRDHARVQAATAHHETAVLDRLREGHGTVIPADRLEVCLDSMNGLQQARLVIIYTPARE